MNKTWRRFALVSLCLTLGLASLSALAQGSWKPGAPIPQGANEVIGANVGGYVLVYGGQDPANKPMGLFWKFDPAANQWTQLPSNPVPVHHGAAAAIGHKFYVFGGFRLPDTGKVGWYPENKAWVFDMDKGTWSALPPMPTPRGALAAVAVGKKIYVSGGAKIPTGVNLPDGLSGGGHRVSVPPSRKSWGQAPRPDGKPRPCHPTIGGLHHLFAKADRVKLLSRPE